MNLTVMNTSEAADYLKISIYKLHQLTKAGKIPFISYDRHPRFVKEQLNEFIEKNSNVAVFDLFNQKQKDDGKDNGDTRDKDDTGDKGDAKPLTEMPKKNFKDNMVVD